MIQEIFPKIFHNQYNLKLQNPDSNSLIVISKGRSILFKCENELVSLPKYSEFNFKDKNFIYLFSIDSTSFFFIDGGESDESLICLLQNKGFQFDDIMNLRHKKPQWLIYASAVAHQLCFWYQSNSYCGKCGNKLHHDDVERMLKCDECGNMIYPKISPAVIVGVISGNKILLTKYAGRSENPRYALIAGFTEIGETIEETVSREVEEEVGLKVKNIRYYKSQPWPFTDTVLMGFFCEVDGNEDIVLDENELSTAEWITRDEMTIEDDGISLTYEMIGKFKKNEV